METPGRLQLVVRSSWVSAYYLTYYVLRIKKMSLSRQRQSRLEEAKVEKRQEDEDYLARHPEIGAAIRVISRVGIITFDLA